MVDYEIGDKVMKKGELQSYRRPFIFLGTTRNDDLPAVKNVLDVMGSKVEIGLFAAIPPHVEKNIDGLGYTIPIIIASVDLYELMK